MGREIRFRACNHNSDPYRKEKIALLRAIYDGMRERSKYHSSGTEFGKRQFIDVLLKNKAFKKMFIKWVRSGRKANLKPSIGRIDYRQPYTIRNCRLVTWRENNQKGFVERDIQKLIPVAMYTMNGDFIRAFCSLSAAANIARCPISNIIKCVKGKRNHAAGFKWGLLHKRVFENPELLQEAKR